jgi:hypothetical protein
MRRVALLIGVAAAWMAAAAPALGHVQVRPTVAAPGDPVLWQVIVPGESDARTVKVELKIPKGVLPFSFEDTPGWRRDITLAPDDSIDVVTWRGRLAPDGFVRFSFLASTPEEEGTIAWKAVQTYDDGQEAAWVEGPESESPAPVTRISASAPRENAGGEGEAAAEGSPPAANEGAPAAATTEASSDDDGGASTGLAIAALVVGGLGLIAGVAGFVTARRRPSVRV